MPEKRKQESQPVVLSAEDYDAVPPWFHPHPQGKPCQDGCREAPA
jgi:hypothetical protein